MQAPEGVIIGGWGYVVAAFTVTLVVLAGYALLLISRLRRHNDREPTE